MKDSILAKTPRKRGIQWGSQEYRNRCDSPAPTEEYLEEQRRPINHSSSKCEENLKLDPCALFQENCVQQVRSKGLAVAAEDVVAWCTTVDRCGYNQID